MLLKSSSKISQTYGRLLDFYAVLKRASICAILIKKLRWGVKIFINSLQVNRSPHKNFSEY